MANVNCYLGFGVLLKQGSSDRAKAIRYYGAIPITGHVDGLGSRCFAVLKESIISGPLNGVRMPWPPRMSELHKVMRNDLAFCSKLRDTMDLAKVEAEVGDNMMWRFIVGNEISAGDDDE